MPQPHLNAGIESPKASPNYVGLVQFLMQPFLESPETLSIDCEISCTLKRAWIRIAFESKDKGKVFGRGGRNIQAIRTVIAAAAEVAGQSVYLDMYGSNALGREGMSSDDDQQERSPSARRGVQSPEPKTPDKTVNIPKPVVKPRIR
ncbi:KH domain-containing protein [Microcystis aeruginosa CS-567/02-A1]|uniref:KH domain-containing protein n=1 Tax=Microcystis aeruginosa TaxID=1126 RepID=UPI002330C4A4|nr:KH domain-containing protein [Microcystis aeruginosa]MDB9401905.1 KH domain-containing protein [Microcystis aeruginosa CS-567/02-A1]